MSVPLGSRLLPAWSPIMTAVRSRTRAPNIKKPAIPHWTRAVVLKLVEPIHKDPVEGIHPRDTCQRRQKALQSKTEQVNPFEQILAKELLEKIDTAKLVAIFHKLPMTEAEFFTARVHLNKISLQYIKHNNSIMRLAFMGTKYETLLKLYESTTCTFFGDELAVAKLLKLERKISGLVLLGGVVEGRFMSVQDMKYYASLPSLHTLQTQLVSILSTPAQHLSQNLSANQVELSSSLSRYAADNKPDGDAEASPTLESTE